MKAFARQSLFAAVWLAGALLLPACQSQALGERCDIQNGAADCASGLTCGRSKTCCVPGTPECEGADTESDAAPNTPGSDATTEGSSMMTGEAATTEAATHEAGPSEAVTHEAAPNEAAATTSDTGVDAGIVIDGAAE